MVLCVLIFLTILSRHLVLSATVDPPKSYDGYKSYEVNINNEQQMMSVMEITGTEIPDIVELHADKKYIDYLVPPETAKYFESTLHELGVGFILRHENISEIIRTETKKKLRKGFSWDAYYDIDDIYGYLRETNKIFPDITKIVKGGDSYQGRSITGLRIRTSKANATKPAIIIESGIHAREWITPATSTYLIQQLLTSQNPDIVAMKDSFDWHIFPSVNPDGYAYTRSTDRYWRKTRSRSSNGCSGADPNRNWGHNWGEHGASSNPCDYQIYAGSEVFSEIETRSFSKYIARVENLVAYVGLHSYGEMLLLPYSDSKEHCDNYDDLVQIGKVSLQYGERVNGVKYSGPNTAAEILYKASGGSMDWVREALGTPLVFTYELRGRNFHWPPERIPEQGEEVVQMILGLITEATALGYF